MIHWLELHATIFWWNRFFTPLAALILAGFTVISLIPPRQPSWIVALNVFSTAVLAFGAWADWFWRHP